MVRTASTEFRKQALPAAMTCCPASCRVMYSGRHRSPRGIGGIQPRDTSFDASNRAEMLINHHHSAEACLN
ncbi:hypothetical protein HZ326_6756 [Fusarium oxysporum f. sp. albedinis]|nr:hypothetical protein HZ326_6756 [Fusarium oxysporum f. sp. albedinis]